MTEPSPEAVEALAWVLRSVGVEIGYAGADTYRTVVAERILADPGPLLDALAEAGVLRVEQSDPHMGHGCWQDPDDREGWQECGPDTVERRYVTDWSPDARA